MTATATVSPAACVEAAWSAFAAPPGLVGLGIDLVLVDDVKAFVQAGGPVFLERILTKRERDQTEDSPERIAGRWAAKEAVMKAIGWGLGDIDPLHIKIETQSSGQPKVTLSDSAAERAPAGLLHWEVSIAHETLWAVAIAAVSPASSLTNSPDALKGKQ